MDVYLWSCAIYLFSIEGSKSQFVLTPSSDRATTGIDFNFTCIFTYTYAYYKMYVILYRDDTIECAVRMVRGFGYCSIVVCNESYSYTCNDNALVLTIPGTIDLDNLHGSSWNCRSLDVFLSNTVILYVNIPITKVNLTVIPYDKNPIAILSGSTQQFQCTTNAGRPSSRIEWYISGANITAKAFLQTDQCNSECNETLITSSVLIYTGNMIDIGKIIYCIAENVKKQSVRSLDRRIDILYPPVIADIPDYNIIEGNTLYITPFIDANPNAMSVWWTRQNDTSYIYNGMNLTISNIQRDYGDYYKCNAMNTITIPSQSTQNKTTEMLFKVNVQYEPVISGIHDYNIEAGRTLNVSPTVDAYPPPSSVWWTRQNNIKFIYYGWNLTIINIQERDSDKYTCHVMNTLTPSGLIAQNRTSKYFLALMLRVSK
ncbi:unnamed protein product [Mytilus edulis]|uniref:Ig-like domain-containing protein n=1 Tax=Mytilus edulis TaxID=6550 RepID=A0A8S3SVX1_MYTED|nr:unnamed protein product [Mytilus edulis]